MSHRLGQPIAASLAGARVQHALDIGPECSMLGVTADDLRAVDPIMKTKVTIFNLSI